MQKNDNFELIINNKVYQIPSKFPSLSDVNPDIYNNLITKKKYIIKTKVDDHIIESFIKHWITGQFLEIQQNNISDFKLLSKEFDRDADIIEMYQKYYSDCDENIKKQETNKLQIQTANLAIKGQNEKYHFNISTLFLYNKIGSLFDNDEIKHEVYSSCINGNTKFVSINCKKRTIENGFTFILDEDLREAGVIGYDNSKDHIVVPTTIKYEKELFPVTTIFESAFTKSQIIKSIEFQEDSELRLIDDLSFSHLHIESITIPSKVKIIGKSAFSTCDQLKTVNFSKESELEIIDNAAFESTSIESIVIPSKVKKVCEKAFLYCKKLKSVIFLSNQSELRTLDQSIFFNSTIKSLTIPSSIEELNERWCIKIIENAKKNFLYYDDKFIIGKSNPKSDIFDIIHFVRRDIENVTIPSFIKMIGPYSFESCSRLRKVEFLEDSELEYIEKYAFTSSSLATISIPKQVKRIDSYAFNSCRYLTTITFSKDSGLQFIGDHCFCYSSIESITFPQAMNIGPFAFSDCFKLKRVAFESKLETIGFCAFSGSSIESLTIPSSVFQFEDKWCTKTNNLKDITVIECDKKNIFCYENKFIIGKSNPKGDIFDSILFSRRDIENVTIPSFIKIISPFSFEYCNKLKEVNFSEESKLEEIQKYAFTLSSLERIKLPSSIKIIDCYGFLNCRKLKIVEFPINCELKSIGGYAFGFSSIEYISLPAHLKRIGFHSFSECKKLETVNFPKESRLQTIDKGAFSNSGIVNLTLPSNIKELNEEWCYNSFYLTNIKIPENEERNILYYDNKFIIGKSNLKIDEYNVLYISRRDITKVIVPSFIKRIARYAFHNCKQIKTIDFSDNSQLNKIDQFAFSDSSIEHIIIPTTVVEIGSQAFYRCSKLEFIDFPNESQLKIIDEYAFSYSMISCIFIPHNVTKINNFAFSNCRKLKIVEFEDKTGIKLYDKKVFQSTTNDIIIMVPK